MSRLLEATGAADITHPCVGGPVHWERDEGCCWSVTEQAMKRRWTMLHVPRIVYRILNCYTLREKLSSVFRISSALSIANERYWSLSLKFKQFVTLHKRIKPHGTRRFQWGKKDTHPQFGTGFWSRCTDCGGSSKPSTWTLTPAVSATDVFIGKVRFICWRCRCVDTQSDQIWPLYNRSATWWWLSRRFASMENGHFFFLSFFFFFFFCKGCQRLQTLTMFWNPIPGRAELGG